MNDLYGIFVSLIKEFNTICALFNMNITDPYGSEEKALHYGLQLSVIETEPLRQLAMKRWWIALSTLLHKANMDQRKYVFALILKTYPEVMADMPDDLIVEFYCWRKHDLTKELSLVLAQHGRQRFSHEIQYLPFKPSKLRNQFGCCASV